MLAPTCRIGEGGVRGVPGAVGRQRQSLPAGVLAAAALPHVQVAAVALQGGKHKHGDCQQERTVLEGTFISLTACLQRCHLADSLWQTAHNCWVVGEFFTSRTWVTMMAVPPPSLCLLG